MDPKQSKQTFIGCRVRRCPVVHVRNDVDLEGRRAICEGFGFSQSRRNNLARFKEYLGMINYSPQMGSLVVEALTEERNVPQ